ncbi:MAG: Trp family transcriptional regulator [bacterium]|nr:Trp family transcriptional regulator [bacterium]
MARISKKYINEQILIKLYRLFFEVISRFKDRDNFVEIIDEILSPTEKIMIAKRIGIIYLLIKKVDYRDIAEVLKVSTATVFYYAIHFDKKESQLVDTIKTMLVKEKVLGFLDDILSDIFIQPGLKIGHWQKYWDHKRKQNERKILPG